MDRILKFTRHQDGRGLLTVLDRLPFPAVRAFTIESDQVFNWRGGHALRTCHQLLIPTKSGLLVNLDDGTKQKLGVIPGEALYLPPMTWIDYAWGSPGGGAAIVLCSHHYDPADYISDRAVFISTLASLVHLSTMGKWGIPDPQRVSEDICGNG